MSRPRGVLRNIQTFDVTGATTGTSPSEDRVRRSALRILEENVLCSMASSGADHRAHIHTCYFCYSDDLAVFFLSHPASGHCRRLAESPSMAVAVTSSAQRWGGPDRGLQLFGACDEARGGELATAEELYGKRFFEYSTWKRSLAAGAAARDYRFYRFVATALKVLDEEEFGGATFVAADVERIPSGSS